MSSQRLLDSMLEMHVADPLSLESDEEIAVTTTERTVLALAGKLSAVDVWASLPAAWAARCRLRIYGTVGAARALLDEVAVGDLGVRAASGRMGGAMLSVRGVPVESFEVTALVTSSEEVDGEVGGQFFAQAWSGAEPRSIGLSRARQLSTLDPIGTAGRNAPPKTTKYAVSSPPVTTGLGAGSTSLGYLFHKGGRERAEIHRITVAYFGASTTGSLTLRGTRITAEASSPGGTAITSCPALDPDDVGSATPFRYAASGAPTTGNDLLTVAIAPTAQGTYSWLAGKSGPPIVLRPGFREGFELRAVVEGGLTSGMTFSVNVEWRETPEEPRDLAAIGFVNEWRADRQTTVSAGNVISWRDDISGVELSETTHAPSLALDSNGVPYIDFDGTHPERLDRMGAVLNHHEDHTVLLVLEQASSDGLVFSEGNASGTPFVIFRHVSGVWSYSIYDGTVGGSDVAYVSGSPAGWNVFIMRRAGNVFTARRNGTNGTPATAAIADFDVDRMSLGSYWTGAGHDPNVPTMKVRHFGIARRALSDAECSAVEALMATYWPDLP